MKYLRLSALLLFSRISQIYGYDGEVCCRLAKKEHAFVGDVPDFINQTCGQSFEANTQPALPLYVPFHFCSDRCGGMDLTLFEETKSWTAPIVQFILPSVIFSMTIPRQKKFEIDYLFDFKGVRNGFWKLTLSMFLFWLTFIPVVIDTVIWISTIVVAAGNMIVSGIYEAFIDYRIIKYVQFLETQNGEEMLERKSELLITIASGNLQLGKGNPQIEIPKAVTVTAEGEDGREKSKSRLLNLLGAQSSFGGAVGSPVLFYLGAFGYTILELQGDPSSQPAAISLGFGIEWMIIVHVAIISGCLLASNNPSTSSGIVGSTHASLCEIVPLGKASSIRGVKGWEKSRWAWPAVKTHILRSIWSDVYDTEYQPVSMWARGANKMRWVKQSEAYKNDPDFRKQLRFGKINWLFKIWLMSFILIVVPPTAGGVVAYATPPTGFGCRSLSFVVYAACQTILVTFSVINTAIGSGTPETTITQADESAPTRLSEETSGVVTSTIVDTAPGIWGKAVPKVQNLWQKVWQKFFQYIFLGNSYIVFSIVSWILSLFSAVGGTLMQIIGVYNNCICYAGAKNWWRLWAINPTVNLASDTLLAREAAKNWEIMGWWAAGFMVLNTYLGWWYQRLVRKRFQQAVKTMDVLTGTVLPPSIPQPDMGRRFTGGADQYEMSDLGDGKRRSVEEQDKGEPREGAGASFSKFGFGKRGTGIAIASGSRRGSEQVGSGRISKRNTGLDGNSGGS